MDLLLYLITLIIKIEKRNLFIDYVNITAVSGEFTTIYIKLK